MIPLFVLAFHVGPPGFETTPEEAVRGAIVDSMARDGYVFEPALGVPWAGTLRRGAEAMGIQFPPTDDVRTMNLSIEIETRNERRPGDAYTMWSRLALEPEPLGTSVSTVVSVSPHFGRTATLMGQVSFQRVYDPTDLARALARVWGAARSFAAQQGTPFRAVSGRNWATARFPIELLVDPFDAISFDRFFDSWGWHAPRSGDFDDQPFSVECTVGGRRVGAYVYPGYPAPSPLLVELRTFVRARPASSPSEGITTLRKRFPDLRWTPRSPGRVAVMKTVRLEPPLSLGRLRKAFRDFAASADRVAQTLSGRADARPGFVRNP